MEIKNISKVDPGVLLLAAAKNAEHITPRLQDVIAQFMEVQTVPKMVINKRTKQE